MSGELVKTDAAALPVAAPGEEAAALVGVPDAGADYSLHALPMRGDDRGAVDRFALTARAARLTQNEFDFAARWALTQIAPGDDFEGLGYAFIADAIERGWSDRKIVACVRFAAQEAGIVPRDSAATKASPSRRAEIEAIMRNEPRRYWGSGALQSEYRALLEVGS